MEIDKYISSRKRVRQIDTQLLIQTDDQMDVEKYINIYICILYKKEKERTVPWIIWQDQHLEGRGGQLLPWSTFQLVH